MCIYEPTRSPTTPKPSVKPSRNPTRRPVDLQPATTTTTTSTAADNDASPTSVTPTKSPIIANDTNPQQQCGQYHPDPESQDSTTKRCTNGLNDFPSVWYNNEDLRSQYFYETGDDCCRDYWGENSCDIVDLCDVQSGDTDGDVDDVDANENNGSEEGDEGATCGKWHPESDKQKSWLVHFSLVSLKSS